MKKFVSIVLLILMMGTMAFAEGDFTLESSSIENGASGVSVEPEFKLDFSKNVVNMKVKENNMTMFELIDEAGEMVPLVVEMGDDQVDREIRNTIIVKPEAPLAEGSIYTLKILSGLTSKNGVSLDKDISINFTTEGEKASSEGTFSPVVVGMVALVLGAVVGNVVRKRRG